MAAAYPTGDDLATYLAAFGVTLENPAPLDTFAAAGVARFELETGRKMLAGDAEARAYDPPATPLLSLEDDLAELTSITYTPRGSAGEVFANGDDYRLLPQNAAAKGKPFEFIDFIRVWWLPLPNDLRSSLSVLGRWGYGTTIPDDAWLAMLAAGVAPLWDSAALAQAVAGGGTLSGWKEGNSSETYASPSAEQRAAMKEQFLIDYPATVAAYTKVRV